MTRFNVLEGMSTRFGHVLDCEPAPEYLYGFGTVIPLKGVRSWSIFKCPRQVRPATEKRVHFRFFFVVPPAPGRGPFRDVVLVLVCCGCHCYHVVRSDGHGLRTVPTRGWPLFLYPEFSCFPLAATAVSLFNSMGLSHIDLRSSSL